MRQRDPSVYHILTGSWQSCKEELEGGRMNDLTVAHEAIGNLWSVIRQSARDVELWGGEFPFDRASNSIECWKI